MPQLLRRAALSASGLRDILTATLGAAGLGATRSPDEASAAHAQARNSKVNHRLDRLEL
jgi:hypothetical protein